MALKSFVCLNLMVLLSIFSSNSFLTLCNSYKCTKCIHHHLFLWVCPFCIKCRATTLGMYLLPPLLLSLHEPQYLAKILASLIITGLSNNMRLGTATLMLMEVFQEQNQIPAELCTAPCSNAVLCIMAFCQWKGTGMSHVSLKNSS